MITTIWRFSDYLLKKKHIYTQFCILLVESAITCIPDLNTQVHAYRKDAQQKHLWTRPSAEWMSLYSAWTSLYEGKTRKPREAGVFPAAHQVSSLQFEVGLVSSLHRNQTGVSRCLTRHVLIAGEGRDHRPIVQHQTHLDGEPERQHFLQSLIIITTTGFEWHSCNGQFLCRVWFPCDVMLRSKTSWELGTEVVTTNIKKRQLKK